jgi:hypothetical protein
MMTNLPLLVGLGNLTEWTVVECDVAIIAGSLPILAIFSFADKQNPGRPDHRNNGYFAFFCERPFHVFLHSDGELVNINKLLQ